MNTLLKKLPLSIALLTMSVSLIASDESASAKVATAERMYQQATQLYKDKNFPAAVECYKKAAELDSLKAYKRLGELYVTGVGVEPNHASALEWLMRAAECGDIEAQTSIGWLYYSNGPGLEKNTDKAKEWLARAIRLGSSRAQQLLKIIEDKDGGIPSMTPLPGYEKVGRPGTSKPCSVKTSSTGKSIGTHIVTAPSVGAGTGAGASTEDNKH